MNKLLRANFTRLAKNKAFWLCISAAFLIATYKILDIYRQASRVGGISYGVLEDHYFESLPVLGILSAIVISLFLGSEYSEGTMRNKLIVGCTRINIYLSSVVTGAVVSTAFTAAYFIGGLVGIPLLGAWEMPISSVLLYMLAGVLSSIALAAIFTFIGVNCSRKAESAVITILIAFALIILGSVIYNKLQEPEMVSEMLVTANGIEKTDPHLNPDYVGGTLRSVMTTLLHILPSGQQILMSNLELTQPMQCVCYSIGLTVIVTVCGTIIYRKKDLK